MKKTEICKGELFFPEKFSGLLSGAVVYDSSSSPEARVYFIDKDGGYYLKRGKCGTLENESELDEYFHSLGLGPKVIEYVSGEYDWLLTRAVSGDDLTHGVYLSEPKRLATLMGESLRELHDTDFSACPKGDRLGDYLTVMQKNYSRGIFDESFSPVKLSTPDEAMKIIEDGVRELRCDTLTHGDFCLPNIICKDWALQGYIDLGQGGVSDRHVDLFWGAWTLKFNLGTDKFADTFFDAYGREKIDRDIISLIGIIECFG